MDQELTYHANCQLHNFLPSNVVCISIACAIDKLASRPVMHCNFLSTGNAMQLTSMARGRLIGLSSTSQLRRSFQAAS